MDSAQNIVVFFVYTHVVMGHKDFDLGKMLPPYVLAHKMEDKSNQ